MPILLTCECGKKLRVNDESAGKRVRCPSCKAILQAPAKAPAETEAPPPKAKSRPAPVEDDRADDEPPRKPVKSKSRDDDEEDRPRKAKSRDDEEDENDDRPRRRDNPRNDSPAKPSSGRLLVLLGVGVLLLAGGSVAIWLLTRDDGGAGAKVGGGGPAASKDQLVGIWQVDIDATKAANPQNWQRAFAKHAFELNKDGSFRQMLNFQAPIEPDKGTWKIVQQDKVAFKVELTRPNASAPTSQIWLVPKGADTLFLDPRAAGFPTTVMKRVQQFPTPAGSEPVDPKPPVEPKKPAEPAVFTPRAEFLHGDGDKKSERDVLEMRLSRDGRRLSLWSDGPGDGVAYTGKVQIWDVSGDPKKVKQHTGSMHAMSPDGSRLLWRPPASPDLCVMEADTGKVITKIGNRYGEVFFPSNDTVWEIQSRFGESAKKKMLEIYRYDADTGKRSAYTLGDDNRGYFAPYFQEAAEFHFITRFNKLLVWDSKSQKMKEEIPLQPQLKQGEKLDIYSSDVAVSSDGKWLVTTVTTRDTVATRAFDLTNLANSKDIPFKGVFQHQFVPGRHVVLSSVHLGADKSEVQAFDLGENRVVARFVGVEHATPKLVISADGSTFAVANAKGKVQIWDLKQLK